MDQQQQQQISQAAEQFANAITESYRLVADRTVSAQELNAELTQSFFNSVIDNLPTQAESNQEVTQHSLQTSSSASRRPRSSSPRSL